MIKGRSNNHGGRREGAGRPSLGITKKVSLTLDQEIWDELEEQKGEQTMSAYLREIILNHKKGGCNNDKK